MRGGLANLNHNVNTTHSSAPVKSAVATIASSCDATFCEGWQRQDSVLYRDYGTSHSASICAFQLEGTLILTDGDQNWTLFNNNVKTRLAKVPLPPRHVRCQVSATDSLTHANLLDSRMMLMYLCWLFVSFSGEDPRSSCSRTLTATCRHSRRKTSWMRCNKNWASNGWQSF